MTDLDWQDIEDHDRGLVYDTDQERFRRLISRRDALGLLGAGAAVTGGYRAFAGSADAATTRKTSKNWLRGVQVANSTGHLWFRSIFPGAYPGRWPHIHFEVYRSLKVASTYAGTVTGSVAKGFTARLTIAV